MEDGTSYGLTWGDRLNMEIRLSEWAPERCEAKHRAM
jgi:hypothetical protein